MAFDPLATIEQTSQGAQRTVHADATRIFHGMDGTHLVGDGADATDACCNVRRFAIGTATQEGLKKARWLEDFQLHVYDALTPDPDVQGTLTLNPGERVHLDRSTGAHGSRSHGGTAQPRH